MPHWVKRTIIFSTLGVLYYAIGLVWWQVPIVMFGLWTADAIDEFVKD